MRANLIPLVLALTVAVTLSAHAGPPAPPLVKFGGAIGVDPLTAAGGVDVLNIVRGISPGGRAWVQRKLRATVGTDGHIDVQGAGLLLASGEGIATRATITHVAATLACGPANSTATLFTSPPGALDLAGDFHITGALSQDGVNPAVMPPTCDNPVLLVRAYNPTTNTAGAWFAAGIPNRDDD